MNLAVSHQAQRLLYLRDLLYTLVARDMKLRYKRSVLGIAWSLLNPLAQLLVFYLIFGFVLPLNIPNYPSFLLTGLLAWSWFQSSLLLATGALVDNRELIKRPGFPAAILPATIVTTHLIHFLLALPILMLFLMLDGGQLTSAILSLALVVALQFLLTLGLTYLVATFHVRYRDTQYLLALMLQLLFFLTPVFYDVHIIPVRYQALYLINPVAYLIDAYRAILIRGELPDPLSLLVLGGIASGLLSLSYLIFMRASDRFAEEL